MTITTTTPPLSSSRKFEGGLLKTAQQNHARSGQLLDQKRQMVDNKHQAIISCETELAEMKVQLVPLFAPAMKDVEKRRCTNPKCIHQFSEEAGYLALTCNEVFIVIQSRRIADMT